MTLQQIKYAITIYECGQFGNAAEVLFVSQPALTKAINELERELGFPIFVRTKKGIIVTETGEDFITYARQVMMHYEILVDKFRDPEKLKKKFGVSCQHYTFASGAFFRTIKKFDSSKFDFSIRETTTSNIIHDVSTMRSEIGVLFITDFNERFINKLLLENGLEFHSLIRCSPYVFFCKDNPLANKQSIGFDDLAEYPCVAFEQGDGEPYFLSEELLPLHSFDRIIRASDKLTMLNLIAEMNAYTLCTNMNFAKINGREYISVPFESRENGSSSEINIGYIVRKNQKISEIGLTYIENTKLIIKDLI